MRQSAVDWLSEIISRIALLRSAGPNAQWRCFVGVYREHTVMRARRHRILERLNPSCLSRQIGTRYPKYEIRRFETLGGILGFNDHTALFRLESWTDQPRGRTRLTTRSGACRICCITHP